MVSKKKILGWSVGLVPITLLAYCGYYLWEKREELWGPRLQTNTPESIITEPIFTQSKPTIITDPATGLIYRALEGKLYGPWSEIIISEGKHCIRTASSSSSVRTCLRDDTIRTEFYNAAGHILYDKTIEERVSKENATQVEYYLKVRALLRAANL